MKNPTEHSPQLRTQVESDIADLSFRQPIVDERDPDVYQSRPDESLRARQERVAVHREAGRVQDRKVDYEWLAVTEAARRAIIASPEVRHAATAFAVDPLSESLPQRALHELSEIDSRVARLAKLTKKTLGAVLDYAPVPDELLVPDLRTSPSLARKEAVVESLIEKKINYPQEYNVTLEGAQERVAKTPGITEAERELSARRYRFAREVKLLGLMAELHDQPMGTTEPQDGLVTHELKSGTKIVMTGEAFDASPALFNPEYWQSRRQLKDRVYEIGIDGKSYIMKERKTDRHIDTAHDGHQYGLTSQQEFKVAQEFAELGVVRKGDIEERWEKPLGYVEFPDGFQFCLFESEADLRMDVQEALADEIKEAASEYSEEFTHIRERAKQLYDERKDLLGGFDRDDVIMKPKRFAFSRAARREKKAYKERLQPDELSFEEFASLKAYHMVQKAGELLGLTVVEQGYSNSDTNDYAFRIRKDKRPILEIIGFDFEYFKKSPQAVDTIMRNMRRMREDGSEAMGHAYRFGDVRGIGVAASYSILEQMGAQLPEPPRVPPPYI